MRRLHILSLLLLVVLLPLAAACGGPVETPTSTQGATEAPAVTEEPEATEETDEAEEPEATEETDEAEEPEATDEADEAEDMEEPEATDEAGAEEEGEQIRIGLVTDIGRVNDGTFNQFAHEGAELAAEEFGLEYDYIETQSQADYAENIQTFVDEGYDVIVTVGFLIADATFAAAQENPDVTFIGVDQSFTGERALPNVSGIQFREDQSGFLVGALAGMMTESDIVGFVGGMEIPPVKKFRNGYANGITYVNPDARLIDVYIPSFNDPAAGASAAGQQIGEGADVIFGAGGPTGSNAIKVAADQDIWVIGVDQDEYDTTFGGGETPGADKLLTSAVKRVDVGVYNELESIVDGTFEGSGDYILSVSNGGIDYADFHDAADAVPDAVKTRLDEIKQMLADEELTTGVDPASGDLDEATIPEPVPFEE